MSTPLTILHDGHRKVLRVGANDNMSTVVQMACKEFGLDAQPGSLALIHKRASVDLSQPFRFTGIPQNATLELTATPAPGRRAAARSSSAAVGGGQVRVAMRLPGGRRVQASFSSDTSLHGLLRSWADGGEIDEGVLQQGPSLQFMRTAYGTGELESTTLRSIGLVSGTAMFTLSLSAPSEGGESGAPLIAVPSTSTTSTVERGGVGFGTGTARDFPGTVGAQEASGVARPPGTASAAAPVSMDHDGPQAPEAGGSHDVGSGKSGGEQAPDVGAIPQVVSEQTSSTAAASTGAQEMDVDTNASAPRAPPRAEPLPTMGIDTCRAALAAMSGAHFDADSTACVITLTKMIDNVVHRPDDGRTRQIRCANAAFQQKIGRIRGGIGFLEGVGFVSKAEEAPSQLFGGSSGGRGGGGRILVLPPDRENESLLKTARDLLAKQAVLLGVPQEKMPQPPRPPPPQSAASSTQGPQFDPYKPFVTSTAPTPKGPQEQSLTEKRLMELQAKMAVAEAGGIPDRNMQVTLPSQVAALATASSSGKGDAGVDASSDMDTGGGGSGSGGGGDGGLIAKKVARQMAERKKREDMPFQTRAMREIERLQKATVYRTTLIKIQFPDRVVIQATFGSREGVVDVVNVVKGSFEGAYQGREFELYVSPPRTVLKEVSSLSDAGLVPAALVYVSWKATPPAGEPEGGYLKPELTNGSEGGGGVGAVPARPAGVVLDPGQAEAKGEAGGIRLGGRGAGTSGASGSGSKRKGKPSWLKIT